MKNLFSAFLLILSFAVFGQTEITLPAPDSVEYRLPVIIHGGVPAEICLVYTLDSVKVYGGGLVFYSVPRTAERDSVGLFIFNGLKREYKAHGKGN